MEQQRMAVINEAATKRQQLAAVSSIIEDTYEKGRLEERIKALDTLLLQVNENPEGVLGSLRTETGQADALLKELGPQPVGRIVMSAEFPVLHVGQTQPLTVKMWDKKGRAVTGRLVTWSSSNDAVALVSANGEVTGMNPGRATLFASAEGNSSSTNIEVKPVPPAASLAVTPNPVTMLPGEETQLTVKVTDAEGQELTGKSITWSSADSAIASVSNSGMVTGMSEGQTTVSVTVDDKTEQVSVSVAYPPAETVQP
jgi:uncharacterized protein YjdB